jgi:ATP-dependent Lon protease
MTASKWTAMLPGLEPIGPEGFAAPETAFLTINLPGAEGKGSAAEEGAAGDLTIPDNLAILPLRGVVVYPLTAIPLTVGQPRSVRLVDDAVGGPRVIGLVTSKDPELETPAPEDLYRVGTAAVVHRLFRAPDGTIRLLVQGLARFTLGAFTATEPYLRADITLSPESSEDSLEVEALVRNVRETFQRVAELVPSMPGELLAAVLNVDDPRQLVYTVATYQRMELRDAQELLETDSVTAKLKRLLGLLTKELEVLELGKKIQSEAQSSMEKVQREYFLREQLKAIQRELGEKDEQAVEIEEFRQKIEAAGLPEEARKEANRELDRLSKLPTAAAEYGVIRTYLDWLTSLPWSKGTSDNLDIQHARAILDEDHYGLKDVKERILEFLAVRKRRQELRGHPDEASRAPLAPAGDGPGPAPGANGGAVDHVRREREGVILCFVGPPGVGKTSLGQSIARAMGRKFVRMALGGVRDEAEVRGFRRTYIGSMPGRVIQNLRRVETRNPVFMLDEVDKLGADFRGDPASALLEVLDPEQNREFRDHYLDVPFDLSQVMFITTANTLEPVPAPLRDRMEIISLSGYTEREKREIAKHYLIPRQIKENGLRPGEVSFDEAALLAIIRSYTREAGVRGLERQIGAVCRKVVVKLAEDGSGGVTVTAADVEHYLGRPEYFHTEEVAERTALPGVATALAYTPVGGDIMFIEATQMPGGKGFQLTGQLGEVMQESARAALSYVRANARALGLPEDFFARQDIHLHVPAGATPKDGPSAGVTMAAALASLVSGRPVRKEVGMTGEITLRGQVLPIGGVKEKVLAAHRAGLKTVILPRRNEKDLDDIPDDVRREITFVFADRVEDVLTAALEPARRTSRPAAGRKPGRAAPRR